VRHERRRRAEWLSYDWQNEINFVFVFRRPEILGRLFLSGNHVLLAALERRLLDNVCFLSGAM